MFPENQSKTAADQEYVFDEGSFDDPYAVDEQATLDGEPTDDGKTMYQVHDNEQLASDDLMESNDRILSDDTVSTDDRIPSDYPESTDERTPSDNPVSTDDRILTDDPLSTDGKSTTTVQTITDDQAPTEPRFGVGTNLLIRNGSKDLNAVVVQIPDGQLGQKTVDYGFSITRRRNRKCGP